MNSFRNALQRRIDSDAHAQLVVLVRGMDMSTLTIQIIELLRPQIVQPAYFDTYWSIELFRLSIDTLRAKYLVVYYLRSYEDHMPTRDSEEGLNFLIDILQSYHDGGPDFNFHQRDLIIHGV
jgi:hypothetical protein